MKKSIVIHICVAVIRGRRYMNRYAVVIVCPGSMATGKYLEAQIKNYFDFDIIGIFSAGEVLRKLDESPQKVDYIISTVPINTKRYTVIQVNPFLQMEDMNRIQRMIFQKQKVTENPPDPMGQKILTLKNMISNVIDDSNLANILCEKIEEIVNQYEKKKQVKNSNSIGKLLKRDTIQMIEKMTEWREAIWLAAKPLLEQKQIEELYVEKSIESVEEYGAYIVLGKGVALAHSKKEYGVQKDCLSLLVSKSGIWFPETEHAVHLLFVFASTGQEEHLDILKSIIQLGRNDEKLLEILNMNNPEEVYNRIIYEHFQR